MRTSLFLLPFCDVTAIFRWKGTNYTDLYKYILKKNNAGPRTLPGVLSANPQSYGWSLYLYYFGPFEYASFQFNHLENVIFHLPWISAIMWSEMRYQTLCEIKDEGIYCTLVNFSAMEWMVTTSWDSLLHLDLKPRCSSVNKEQLCWC